MSGKSFGALLALGAEADFASDCNFSTGHPVFPHDPDAHFLESRVEYDQGWRVRYIIKMGCLV
jgi:hypothetical protein